MVLSAEDEECGVWSRETGLVVEMLRGLTSLKKVEGNYYLE